MWSKRGQTSQMQSRYFCGPTPSQLSPNASWSRWLGNDCAPQEKGILTLRTLAVVGVLLAASPAFSEAPPRCAILGQMAVSTWVEMMGALSKPDDATLDPVLSRLADLTSTFDNLGCDTPALGAAMDCLLDRSGSAPPRELARACMSETGLIAGE